MTAGHTKGGFGLRPAEGHGGVEVTGQKEPNMPCLLVILALLLPRVVMVLIFLLTPWFQRVFNIWLLPVLGFVLLPYTTLAYLWAVLNTGGPITPGWLILIVIAALADLGHWGSGYRSHRRR
jgi:hypothetical protein